ncbi:hypothetical protein F5X99DRAFT_362822 [Biscogniauxia marginata]|nr:hypothetical protein F5X99DRAFT_362822 [Biscogniauxia marginata]
MLTHAICRSTPRARSLQTKVAACSILSPSASSTPRIRHRQQTRAYRFGIWSSYLDPEFHRELRRRHRTIKHKYADTVNRSLSWDKPPSADEPRASLKRFIGGYWKTEPARCAPRHVDHDALMRQMKHASERLGAPDTRTNISSTDSFWSNYDSWRSQVDQVVGRWAKEASKGVDRINSDFDSWSSRAADTTAPSSRTKEGIDVNESTAEEDYVIDPITNRKVSKKVYSSPDTETEPSAQTFKRYRSQFTAFVPPEVEGDRKPIYSDGGPAAAELNKYEQVKLDEWVPEGHASDPRIVKATHTSSEPATRSEGYSANYLPPKDKYDDLRKYRPVEYDEVDGNRAEVKPDDEELRKYKPYMYREDVKTEESAPEYDDLDKYRSYNYDEMKQSDNSLPKYDDLDKYRSTEFKDDVDDGKPFQQYGDLERYKTFRYQDLHENAALERDVVSESLKEYDAREREADLTNATESPNAISSEFSPSTDMHDEGSVASEQEPDPVSLSMPWGNSWDDPKDENRQELERFMDSNNEASDVVDQEASAGIFEARIRAETDSFHPDEPLLTGNYVRDFPDEFSGSWEATSHTEHKVEADVSEGAYEQEVQAEIQEAEKNYSDDLTNTTNFSRLEPALDRQMDDPMLGPAPTRLTEQVTSSTPSRDLEEGVEAHPDPYSQELQGLQTSFAEECGEQTMPVYAKTYGEPGQKDLEPAAVETQPVSDPFIPSSEPYYDRDPEIDGFPPTSTSESTTRPEFSQIDGPTVYKILAYDPTMQNINIAETTSVVPDQAAPLSPTEVLLRLSNPTKFFPHFAPLQAEGFEIVSGGGDVLVFRKVRSATAGTKDQEKDAVTAVNPIDMMGKPTGLLNAAEFASPTGFVNYNMPHVEGETQGSSRFRSNIDVRREEPVFSGPKAPTNDEAPKKKKRGVVKRMLFAGTWVAGLSYAIGVVSEYFVTGGVDGVGPTGF